MRGLILAALMTAMPAAAQTNEALLRCARVADGSLRLKCYDEAVDNASAEGHAAVAERRKANEAALQAEAARTVQARLDNFGAERLKHSDNKLTEGQISELSSDVVEVFTDSAGKAVFTLSNGQMWRQSSGLSLPPVRTGDIVRIKRGLVSGYRLTFVRQGRTIPVLRMR